jgi:hypothetical protein
MFYEILKGLHNIVRWVVVLGGIYALVLTLQGLFSRAAWTATVQRAGLIFTSALNLQFVLGLILFFISPYIQGLLQAGMSNIMGEREPRFFVVEHWFSMILAIIAAQLGYSLARRAKDDSVTDRLRHPLVATFVSWIIMNDNRRWTIDYCLSSFFIAMSISRFPPGGPGRFATLKPTLCKARRTSPFTE